ncbi:SIS domain-containing protein [Alkalicoccus luteus]|uniref:SIS domain-containing protein n=1 Tax=Alkalicoccus luteus TaxID=1237094 RepID=UPI004033F382
MLRAYTEKVRELLDDLEQEEGAIHQAAQLAAEAIAKGGILHCFGAGHSHMIGEELFFRAGGLVPVRPVWIDELLPQHGALRSMEAERKNGWEAVFREQLDLRPEDVMIVVSTTGRNPAPLAVARAAKAAGVPVIGITSVKASAETEPRGDAGMRLFEAADVVIDTHVPPGDAVLQDERLHVRFSPVSTVAATTAGHAFTAETVRLLLDWGEEAPVLLSSNIDGADEWNERLIRRWERRIPELRRGGQT